MSASNRPDFAGANDCLKGPFRTGVQMRTIQASCRLSAMRPESRPGRRRTRRRGRWRPRRGLSVRGLISAGEGSVVCVSQKSADPGAWRDLPPAPPPHGSFLAWYQGCRCGPCEASGQGFLRELSRRKAQQRDGGEPYAVRLSADQRAHLEPAVRTRDCPRCGALRHHRCRDPHFPLHFSATHPERISA
jgi:hypothetical protein